METSLRTPIARHHEHPRCVPIPLALNIGYALVCILCNRDEPPPALPSMKALAFVKPILSIPMELLDLGFHCDLSQSPDGGFDQGSSHQRY